MSDLISRKALLEALSESHKHHASNSREESLLIRDIAIVKEQPTAYDPEKIVEQLENAPHAENDGWVWLDDAIEIVKSGGME